MTDQLLTMTDPVCGMAVDSDDAIHIDYQGVTYGFCDPACAEIFRQDPSRWLDGPCGAPFTHGH